MGYPRQACEVSLDRHEWKDSASCKDFDVDLFFDKYEEDPNLRPAIYNLCAGCPVARQCFAVGISQKGYGVWGGVYIENGKISREFNRHRSKKDWAETWKLLTMDKE
jgi:hypothetical protein